MNDEKSHAPPRIIVQGEEHAKGRDKITVRIVGTTKGRAATLAAWTVIALLAGVAAGTSGQYRELVGGATARLGEESIVRRIALAPDRTAASEPLLSERITRLAADLRAEIGEAQEAGARASDAYRVQAKGISALRNAMQDAAKACTRSESYAAEVAEYGWNAQQASEALQAIVIEAARACAGQNGATEGADNGLDTVQTGDSLDSGAGARGGTGGGRRTDSSAS